MTAVATVLALLPAAVGIGGSGGGGSIVEGSLAVVVIGGLLTSTLLTLVVVPVVYSLLDGMRTRLGVGADRDDVPIAARPTRPLPQVAGTAR
jgi:HAE1 family hydrophobic/amphiphilic exporter-1